MFLIPSSAFRSNKLKLAGIHLDIKKISQKFHLNVLSTFANTFNDFLSLFNFQKASEKIHSKTIYDQTFYLIAFWVIYGEA